MILASTAFIFGPNLESFEAGVVTVKLVSALELLHHISFFHLEHDIT